MKRIIVIMIATATITAVSTVAYIGHNADYLNMDTVTGFDATESGLMLYTVNGPRYYWER